MSQAAAANPAPDQPANPPRRRWRRRIIRLLLVVVILLVVVRALFGILLPTAINRAAGLYGLAVDYERSEMNLLSGDVGLWHLRVTPKSALSGSASDASPEPLARVGYVRGNISTWALLKLQLEVWRAEADGAELAIERLPDGRIPLLEQLLAALPAKDPGAAPPPARTGPPTPLDLAPPIKIDAVRLSHATLKIRDRAVQPEFAAQVVVDFRLSDVGSTVRPVTAEVVVWSEPGLDLLRLEGVGRTAPDKLEAEFQAVMRGLTLDDLATYLAPLGLKPSGQSVGGRAAMKVELKRGAAPDVNTIAGQITVTEATLTAAGAVFATLDRLTVEIQSLGAEAARFGQIVASGAQANLRSTTDGGLSFGGLQLSSSTPPPTTRPALAAATPAPRPPVAGKPYLWSLAELKIADAAASFADDSIDPPIQLSARLHELTVRNLAYDPARRDVPAELAVRASIPGIIGSATATGTVAPFAEASPLKLSLRAGEIRPDALKPYLDAINVESLLSSAELTAELAAAVRPVDDGGSPRFDLAVTDVIYRDGDAELLSLPRLAVAGLRLEPIHDSTTMSSRIAAQAIEVVGPQLPVRRDPDGQLVIAGSKRTPGTLARRVEAAIETAVEAATQPAANAAAGIVLQIPPVKIDRFDWSGIRIAWDDGSTHPPTHLGIADAGLQVENLDLDLTPRTDAAPTTTQTARNGTIRGFLSAPGVAERLTLQGAIVSGQGSVTLGVSVSGDGITGKAIAPYLAPSGITPVLENGSLRARAEIRLSQVSSDILRGLLSADQVAWMDGDRELAAVDSATVQGIEFGAKELRIGEVSIVRPRAALARDAGGAIVAGGIRVELTEHPTQGAEVPSRPATPPAVVPLGFAVNLKSLSVSQAALQWSDSYAGLEKPVELELLADARLAGLVFAEESATAPPAAFEATLRIPTLIEALAAKGTIDSAPRSVAVTVTAQGSGIHAGPIAPYFPDGIEPTLADGRFSVDLEAAVAAAAEGGHSARAVVRGLEYSDGEQLLAAVESAKFAASRIDLPGGVIALDEISSAGVQAQVELQEDYLPALLGVALRPVTKPPATQPSEVIALGAEPTGTTTPDAATIAAGARKPLPLLTLDKLDLRLDRLTVNNRAVATAAPATLAEFRLQNLNRLEWGGKTPQNQPATQFRFSGRIDPLVQAVRAEAAVAPFVDQPSIKLQLQVDGLRGQGLTEIVPQISDLIDGRRLTDGRFNLAAEVQLQPDRRGGVIDYTRGFGAELTVRDTSFRNGADGPMLAGVEQVHAAGVRVEPARGNVIVQTLEITKPSAYVLRDSSGIEALGLLIKVLPTTPATQEATEPAAPAPSIETADTAPGSAQPAPPGAEFRIDRVSWSGLDLRIEDRTVDPPIILPVNGFELEASGLSNRALVENRPIRFGMLATAGKIALPRATGGGGIMGAAGDLGALLGGRKNELTTGPVFEDREMFSQVSAVGRLSLYPAPSGWVKTSVSGLELASLRGFAQSFGVTLDGGVYDGTTELRLVSASDMNLRTRLVFTDLKISEPANGPIVRHLKLPAPLDAVIAAVQDADGSITLPLDVPIKEGELQVGAIVGSAVGALGQVLATAVASTPVKAVTGVGGLIGLGKDKKPIEPRLINIDFAPGDASISAAEMGKIRPLLNQLRDKNVEMTLRHELSPGDISIAGARANPSRDAAAAIAAQLRQRRTALLADRAAAAARAQSQLAVLDPRKPAPAVEELRQLDRQIAQTDAAMGAMYDQLRPGAERQAPRRTRTAAIDLGRQRLEVVRALLSPPGGSPSDLSERLRAAPAGFTIDESASAHAGGGGIGTVLQRKK